MQQIQLPILSKTNKTILVIMVVFFVLNSILTKVAGFSLVSFLGLSLAGIQSGLVFQFISFPLVSTGLMDVVFTGLLIWFLGSELENQWGQKNYIMYLLLVTFMTGIFYLIISLFLPNISANPIYGMSIFSSSMCVSYAVLYPDRIFQFFMIIPVKAKYFCMILAFMALYNGVFSPGGSMAWAQLFAMVMGVVFVFLVRTSLYNSLFGLLSIKKKPKSRGNLHIVKNDDKPPRYWQ